MHLEVKKRGFYTIVYITSSKTMQSSREGNKGDCHILSAIYKSKGTNEKDFNQRSQ
jgi:hypothetical protein